MPESTIIGYLLTAIGAQAAVIIYQNHRMEVYVKREQERSDRLASIIERAATTAAEDGKL